MPDFVTFPDGTTLSRRQRRSLRRRLDREYRLTAARYLARLCANEDRDPPPAAPACALPRSEAA